MKTELNDWLCGQVAAIDKLTLAVQTTIANHDPAAAAELMDVRFACNRVTKRLKEAANAAGGDDDTPHS